MMEESINDKPDSKPESIDNTVPLEQINTTDQMPDTSTEENVNSIQELVGSVNQDIIRFNASVHSIKEQIGKLIVGQEELLNLLIIGIFSNGHILLEGVPGIAKTLTAKSASRTLNVDFSRIQFTPDLMPSDVIGTSIFNMKSSEFEFKQGPIFSNIVLIDEINRAPAKTQSALFEVMEERQITFDGTPYKMEYPFLVLATQNPIEQEGTYRLPEAQLDRFLFKIRLKYPKLEEEFEILKQFKNGLGEADMSKVEPVLSKEILKEHQDIIAKIKVEDGILRYIAEITNGTRDHGKLFLGASPRASLSMLKASKVKAALSGRDFIIPDDVQYVAPHVLNHRIILSPEAEMEGILEDDIIQEIIQKTDVPR